MIKWLYDHYILTTLIALYYMVLLGYGTLMVFSQITEISDAGAASYVGLLGLPAAAVALIKWRLDKDNDQHD